MDEPKPLEKLLEQVSNPGDAATVLIFGTAGFLLDAALNPVAFLTASQTGIASASLALGTKKGIEAIWTKRQEQKKARANERRKAKALLDWHSRTDAGTGASHSLMTDEFESLARIYRNMQTSLEDLRAAVERASAIKRADGLIILWRSLGDGQLAEKLGRAVELFHIEGITPDQLQQMMNRLTTETLEEHK